MADKSFGIKQLNLIGSSGTPNLTSPNNLNLNAVTVAISTDLSIGGQVTSDIIVDTNKSIGIGTTVPTSKLHVIGNIDVSGIATVRQLSDYKALVGAASSVTETFVVTVATKTTNHRYYGTGSASGYLIDGRESPFITLLPGKTYRFDQAGASNATHQLRFYLEADRTTEYTTNVTFNGTAGNAGAYTQITVTDTTPIVLHYQCVNHGYMGNAISNDSNFINTPYQITARSGINATGVVTATTFVGALTGNATGLSGTPSITVGSITSSSLNSSGIVTATSFRSTTTTGDGTDIGFALKYYITSSGSSAYRLAGPGVLNSTNNPTLYLHRGFTYIFENSTGGSHPFAIRTSSGGSAYTSSFLSGSQSGTQIFTVPFDAPNTLVYQCTIHSGMVGTLNIVT